MSNQEPKEPKLDIDPTVEAELDSRAAGVASEAVKLASQSSPEASGDIAEKVSKLRTRLNNITAFEGKPVADGRVAPIRFEDEIGPRQGIVRTLRPQDAPSANNYGELEVIRNETESDVYIVRNGYVEQTQKVGDDTEFVRNLDGESLDTLNNQLDDAEVVQT
jgi:hypothetical protein